MSDTAPARNALDEDEKKQLQSNIINPEVGGRSTLVVNEPGDIPEALIGL